MKRDSVSILLAFKIFFFSSKNVTSIVDSIKGFLGINSMLLPFRTYTQDHHSGLGYPR